MNWIEKYILTFVSNDIEQNPENIHRVPKEFWERIKQLVKGVEVNLDEPLEDDDET